MKKSNLSIHAVERLIAMICLCCSCFFFVGNLHAATIPAGTTIFFDNNYKTWGVHNPPYLVACTSNTSGNANTYCPKNDEWIGQMTEMSDGVYYYNVTEEISTDYLSFFDKDESTYNNIWQCSVVLYQQLDPENTCFKLTGKSQNNARQSAIYSGTWVKAPLYISPSISNPVLIGSEMMLHVRGVYLNCTDWEYSEDNGANWTPIPEDQIYNSQRDAVSVKVTVNTQFRVNHGGVILYYTVKVNDNSYAITGGVNGTQRFKTIPTEDDLFGYKDLHWEMDFRYNGGQFKVLCKEDGQAGEDWTWGSELDVKAGDNISKESNGNLNILNFSYGSVVKLKLTYKNHEYTLSAEAGKIFKIEPSLPNPINQGDEVSLTVKGATSPVVWQYSYDGLTWEPYDGETAGSNHEIIYPLPLVSTFYKATDTSGHTTEYKMVVRIQCEGQVQTHLNIDFGTFNSSSQRRRVNGVEEKVNEKVYAYSPEGKEMHDGFYAILANPSFCGRGTRNTPTDCQQTSCLRNVNSSGDYWYQNSYDHTIGTSTSTSLYGAMLMVNCKDKGELIYSYTATGLCEDMFMTFSAWFANAASEKSTTPINARFRILDSNGVEILPARFDVRDIKPSDGWVQGITTFFSGKNTSLTVQIINNGHAGEGNDILIDDIQFISCVPKISIVPGLAVDCGDITEITVETEGLDLVFETEPYYLWQYYDYKTKKWVDIADDPIAAPASYKGSGFGKIKFQYETKYRPVNKPRFRVIMSIDPHVAHSVGRGEFPVCLNYAMTQEIDIDCGCSPQTIEWVSGDTVQTVCQYADFPPVKFRASGAKTKKIGIIGLPEGIQANASGLQTTLQGAATKPGEYHLKIFAEGVEGEVCESDTLTMSITVDEAPVLKMVDGFMPNQALCAEEELTPIQYEYGGSATSYEFKPALAGTLTVTEKDKIITLSGILQATYTYQLLTKGQPASCKPAAISGTLTAYPLPDAPHIVGPNVKDKP